jgi:hypothetical protein
MKFEFEDSGHWTDKPNKIETQLKDQINLLWEAIEKLNSAQTGIKEKSHLEKLKEAARENPQKCNCDAAYTGIHAKYCPGDGQLYRPGHSYG